MQTSQISKRFAVRAGYAAAAGLFALAATASLHAQQTSLSQTGTTPGKIDFLAEAKAPVDLAATTGESSSSSAEIASPVATERLDLAPEAALSDLQPPPRRRYGHPHYQDRGHNADGSNRYAFVVGGGFNVPAGSDTSNYLSTSWRAGVGGGVNFNRNIGLLLQFDYDHFGVPGNILANQATLYNELSGSTDYTGLGGNAHIWSFSLNPTFNVHQGDSLGAYVVAGGGFFHKVTNFTVPTTGTYCDPYYGICYQYATDATVDHYTSNSPGISGGIGITYKPSRFAGERFFAEARVVHTFDKYRAGYDPITNANTNNLYPANSNESTYIPITFGIRF